MGNTKLNNVQAAVQFGDLADIREVYELLHHNTGPSAVTFSSTYRKFWGGRFVESRNGKKPHIAPPTGPFVPQYIGPPYPIQQLVPVTNASGQVVFFPIATVPIAPPLIMDQPGIAPISMYPPYGPYAVPGPPPQMILNNTPNAMIHNSFESANQNHGPIEPIQLPKANAENSNCDELPHGTTIHNNFVDDKMNAALAETLHTPFENGVHESPCLPVQCERSPNGVHGTMENSSDPVHNNVDENLTIAHDKAEESPLNVVEEFVSAEIDTFKVAESNACDENHKEMSHNILQDTNSEVTKVSDETPAVVAKPKPALWSQLFSSTTASANVQFSPATTDIAEAENEVAELDISEKIARDQFTYFIYEKMRKLSLKSFPRVLHLNPRGMNNFGNRCYMHSALQVLIHLPQFYYLLIHFPERPARDVPLSTTPILDALKDFSLNFHLYKQDSWMAKTKSTRVPSADFSIETAFTVQTLIKSLMNHKMFAQGQQEDVEEFLFFILDALHEELSAVDNVYNRSCSGSAKDGGSASSILSATTVNGDLSAVAVQYQNGGACSSNNSEAGYSSQGGAGGEVDEWISMGPRRRGRIMRETDLRESLVTDIFGGTIVSEVRKKGSRNSCTTQRFFTMRLDIDRESIRSLKDALVASFVKEVIPQSGSNKQELTKISYLNKLPETLILQLKLFVYNAKQRCAEKLNKLVTFEEVLEIPASCFAASSLRTSNQQRSSCYKLFAVIYHHGQDANKGHYSAAIFHTGQKTWFQFDDAHVNKIELTNVLNPDINVKVPYLLIYRKFN